METGEFARQDHLLGHVRKDPLTACMSPWDVNIYIGSFTQSKLKIVFVFSGAVTHTREFASSATSFQALLSCLACEPSYISQLHVVRLGSCLSVCDNYMRVCSDAARLPKLACWCRLLIAIGVLHESKTLAGFLGCAACTHLISAITHVWPDSIRLVRTCEHLSQFASAAPVCTWIRLPQQ